MNDFFQKLQTILGLQGQVAPSQQGGPAASPRVMPAGGAGPSVAAPAPQADPYYGLPKDVVNRNRMAAIAQIGAALAQVGTYGQRANGYQALGQVGSDFQKNLMAEATMKPAASRHTQVVTVNGVQKLIDLDTGQEVSTLGDAPEKAGQFENIQLGDQMVRVNKLTGEQFPLGPAKTTERNIQTKKIIGPDGVPHERVINPDGTLGNDLGATTGDGTTVNVDTGEKADLSMQKALGGDFIATVIKPTYEKANAAAEDSLTIASLKPLIDAGMNYGYAGQAKTFIDQQLVGLGLATQDQASANTINYKATVGNRLRAILGSKVFGSGNAISDSDKAAAKEIIQADPANLTEQQLQEGLRIADQLNRFWITKSNEKIADAAKRHAGFAPYAPDYTVAMPDPIDFGTAAAPQGNAAPVEQGVKPPPKPGDIVMGMQFLGGDPGQPRNWAKVNRGGY